MYKRHEIGKIGEEIAEKYLKNKGYKIIEKNFYCRQGEIDIIAKSTKELIFVEVKTRTGLLYGKPSEAVDNIKQKHIYNSAKYYLYKNHLEKSFIRFDVIEIYMTKEKIRVNHIKQVL
jgi:putative endonuclease